MSDIYFFIILFVVQVGLLTAMVVFVNHFID
jgi:hypothetical protein